MLGSVTRRLAATGLTLVVAACGSTTATPPSPVLASAGLPTPSTAPTQSAAPTPSTAPMPAPTPAPTASQAGGAACDLVVAAAPVYGGIQQAVAQARAGDLDGARKTLGATADEADKVVATFAGRVEPATGTKAAGVYGMVSADLGSLVEILRSIASGESALDDYEISSLSDTVGSFGTAQALAMGAVGDPICPSLAIASPFARLTPRPVPSYPAPDGTPADWSKAILASVRLRAASGIATSEPAHLTGVSDASNLDVGGTAWRTGRDRAWIGVGVLFRWDGKTWAFVGCGTRSGSLADFCGARNVPFINEVPETKDDPAARFGDGAPRRAKPGFWAYVAPVWRTAFDGSEMPVPKEAVVFFAEIGN